MTVRPTGLAILALATGGGTAAWAQSSTGPCADPRPVLAVAQTLAVNYAVNRFDALVLGEDWARTGFESWSRKGHGLGWDLGAGVTLPLGERWRFEPGVRVRSLSREHLLGTATTSTRLSYALVSAGFRWAF